MGNNYKVANRADWMKGSVGISVHWTAALCTETGFCPPFEETVNAFDVERFAETLKSIGAKHLIFTTAHAYQYMAMPNAALDAISPGRTTKRDLFGEILDACESRGIRVIAYYNHSCNEPSVMVCDWIRACGCPLRNDHGGDMETFAANISSIIRWMSQRYGRKISGWWFDSAYSVDSHGPVSYLDFKWRHHPASTWDGPEYTFPWQRLLDAARSGNPDAACAINAGVGERYQYSDDTDWYAGESVQFDESFTPEADGRRVDTRWICVDDPGWVFRPEKGFCPLRKPVAFLRDYVRQHTSDGKMVTFNVLIDRAGKFNPAISELAEVLDAATKR